MSRAQGDANVGTVINRVYRRVICAMISPLHTSATQRPPMTHTALTQARTWEGNAAESRADSHVTHDRVPLGARRDQRTRLLRRVPHRPAGHRASPLSFSEAFALTKKRRA